MNKFFIVGRHSLVLGEETKKNNFSFSIGQTIFDQVAFVEVKKVKNIIFIENVLIHKTKNYQEGVSLMYKAMAKHFPDLDIVFKGINEKDLVIENVKSTKFKKLTDVYKDPTSVPWNFVPTEVEDILSKFPKNVLSHKKIIYIGVGYGKNIWALGDKKYDIDAMEFSRAAVIKANKLFNRNLVVRGDLLNFKVENKKYDVVIDIGCLHCIDKNKQSQAVETLHCLMKKDGIIVSRIFKPKDEKWLKRMPFIASEFGSNKKEILSLFKSKFKIKIRFENKYYFIIEAKKC